MSDIFREVEEDVRRERFQKLWKQYGDYVLAAVAVAAIGVASYEVWQRYDANERAKASAAFIAAQNLTIPGAAETAFAKIADTAPGGYRILARLEQADSMLAAGRRDGAIALYKAIAQENNGPVGGVARLRAAWALADSTGKEDLETLLGPLTDPTSAWVQVAREVLAYSDYRAAKIDAAEAEYQSLAADPLSPDSLRQRARAMAAFLKSGGTANFDTVPPPAAGSNPPGVAPPPGESTKGAAKP